MLSTGQEQEKNPFFKFICPDLRMDLNGRGYFSHDSSYSESVASARIVEMKMTKKAFLSTICPAAMKIQKNSHLVITTTKVSDNDVGDIHTSLDRKAAKCFLERFPSLENHSLP